MKNYIIFLIVAVFVVSIVTFMYFKDIKDIKDIKVIIAKLVTAATPVTVATPVAETQVTPLAVTPIAAAIPVASATPEIPAIPVTPTITATTPIADTPVIAETPIVAATPTAPTTPVTNADATIKAKAENDAALIKTQIKVQTQGLIQALTKTQTQVQTLIQEQGKTPTQAQVQALANAQALALTQEKALTQAQSQILTQALAQVQAQIQGLTQAQYPTPQQEQALKQAQALVEALTPITKSVDCILEWSNWSNCDTFTGEQTRTANVSQNAEGKGISCPTKETKPCPVNCQGQWSDWSCDAICPGNTIKYRVKSTFGKPIIGGGYNYITTYIDEQDMNKFVHNVDIPYNVSYFTETLEETDILNNNVFSTTSKITPKFNKFTYSYYGIAKETEKITSYDTTQAKLFRTYKVDIPPLNNGTICPFTNGEIQTGSDCNTNCFDCKYSLTETLACDAACPSWDNQNNIIKSGNAHFMNNFISTVNKDGNQATRAGTYKIIKQESNGGKACLAKDGDIIKENCSKACDFDCKGEWIPVSKCTANCPGNAGDDNNGISSVKSFLAPGTTKPNIIPAKLNKKYKINSNKFPGGKSCETADQEIKSFPCSKECKYNWKYTGCICDDDESSYMEGGQWVRNGINTNTITFINKSHNGGTCDIEEEEEYDSNDDNIWTGSNTFENSKSCKCYD